MKCLIPECDRDLNGKTGTAIISPNPDPNARGFVTALDGHQWAWQGTQQVFVPQLAMYKMPHQFHGRPDMVDADIREFLHEHGFNGLHVPSIAASWFDIEAQSNRIERRMTRPDPRTFEALEMLIAKVYAAGGMVSRKDVSKTATCGVSGARASQASIPARLYRFSIGASGTRRRISSFVWSLTISGPSSINPPWRTRCPMADSSSTDPITPRSGSLNNCRTTSIAFS